MKIVIDFILTKTMDIISSFISVDDVQVSCVSSDMVLVRSCVSSEDLELGIREDAVLDCIFDESLTRKKSSTHQNSRVLQSLSTVISLHQTDHFWGPLFSILSSTQLNTS